VTVAARHLHQVTIQNLEPVGVEQHARMLAERIGSPASPQQASPYSATTRLISIRPVAAIIQDVSTIALLVLVMRRRVC